MKKSPCPLYNDIHRLQFIWLAQSFFYKRHLIAELLTDLDKLGFNILTAHRIEVRTSHLILKYPVARKGAVLYLGNTFFISLRVSSVIMRLPSHIVAILGSIAY